jgi:glucose-6-phosphate 1-dehydrogenase
MQFSLGEAGRQKDVLEAYERLIHDAMTGDRTLFTTAEGGERLSEISEPLFEHPSPVRPYAPGSWGPKEIDALIAPRRWRLPFERKWRGTG